jgi:DNA-binding response OmpR family regulator
MERLDREFEAALTDESPARGPGKVLVLSTSAAAIAALLDVLQQRGHACHVAGTLDEARSAVARQRFDLAFVSRSLGEGSRSAHSTAFLDELAQLSPGTKSVVVLARRSFDDSVAALRAGAIDVIALPMDHAELDCRVESALLRSRTNQLHEDRIARLQRVCKRLNSAREEISDQVEVLCKELVAAYEDASTQLSEVAMVTEFRTLLRQELDVEELLRSALEYLLTKTGPTNAAVFLPDEGGDWSLGAYVNYDCPRESIASLLDQLGEAVCPQMAEEDELVRFEDTETFAQWIGSDVEVLAQCQVIAFACMHEERCMAILVLFRNRAQPFDDSLAHTLDLLRPIFATQLHQIIRVHHRLSGMWPKEAIDEECDFHEDGEFGFGGLAA